ncbi:membrane-bound lytic murein transglycosylase MltF [Chitinimonas taiwanensis]|uniref:membrane-bound lytic murein transglycosylase MltF n=1 Tax=Chitinimonas taiwanensis TaxID=240412 RepID=UPI0035B0951F
MWKGLMCFALLGLSACMPERAAPTAEAVPLLAESGELVVLIRNGSSSFYIDAEGKYAGLDYDLVTRFAQELGVKVRFVVAPRLGGMPQRLSQQEAHLGVGMTRQPSKQITFGPAYLALQPVLVYRSAERKPRSLDDLGEGVLMVSSLFAASMKAQQAQHPHLRWHEAEHLDAEELIEKVESGLIDYAIVNAHGAAMAQNFHPGVEMAFKVGQPQPFAWAWPDNAPPGFTEQVTQFFARIEKDGTLARLLDRYFGHSKRLQPIDATTFLSRRVSVLPRFRDLFIEAEARHGIDWRLLAALSYQESHWDPFATSSFGVRGLMMLTNDTADRLGVSDRLDPEQSIMGGAKYIGLLKDSLPARITEPDRTWIALAGYNIGMAHLEDARILAARQKKNPDSWTDLKTVIPLLRNYEYFSTVKYGFARGGETVIFVENVRSYYDILVRFEAAVKPMFPPFNEQVKVSNPENVPLGIDAKVKAAQNGAKRAELAPPPGIEPRTAP